MGALIFAIILSLLIGGVVLVVTSLKKESEGYDSTLSFRPGFMAIFLGLVVVVLVFALSAGLSSWTQVEYGNVAVVTRFGAVTGRIFNPGLNWKMPFFESTVEYRTQKVIYEASDTPGESEADYTDYSVDTVTKDGQRITVNYTVRLRVDAAKAAWIAQNLGDMDNIVERVVKTESRIWARNVPKEFAAADLYTGNVVEVQNRIAEMLEPIFRENGLILDGIGLRSIKFTEEYADAIENKQIALENVTTARYEAQQELHRKQAAITQAEGRAESTIIEAKGDAEALRLKGEALREYPEVLQLRFIEKLSDKIKMILVPANQPFILGDNLIGGETP